MTKVRSRAISFLCAAAACLACATGTRALADACSEAYGKALAEISSTHDGPLGQAVGRLRLPVDGMPGRWIVGGPADRRGKAGDRPCLETAVTRGRERCIRYGVALPREVEAKGKPGAEEQRVIAQLAESVRGRGAPAEFLPNGRSTGVVARVSSELRNYLSQGARPTLCTGGREVAQFYDSHTAPVSRRFDEVRQLADAVRNLAAVRLHEAAKADAADLAAKAAAKPAEATPPAGAAVATAPTVPPRTAEPAHDVATYAAMSTAAMLAEAAKPLAMSVAATDTPRALLDSLRQAVEKLRSLDHKSASQEVSGAVLATLRMIEARIYADALAARYAQADGSVMAVIRQVRSAHEKHCTCGR